MSAAKRAGLVAVVSLIVFVIAGCTVATGATSLYPMAIPFMIIGGIACIITTGVSVTLFIDGGH